MTTKDAIKHLSYKISYCKGVDRMWVDGVNVDALEIAVSAMAEERKKGEWVGTEYDGYADGNPVYYEWACSECGCLFEDEEPTYNFCPNCGAEMEYKNER